MTTRQRIFSGRTAALCAVWVAACAPVLADGGAPSRLRLRAAEVVTDAEQSLLPRQQSATAFDPQAHYVLQLCGPITPPRRAALQAARVELSEYLPDFAYLVDLHAADLAALAELGFVHWVGRYADAWKIDPAIGHPLAGWRTPERRAIAAEGKLKITVTLFPDADVVEVQNALAAAGAVVVESHRTTRHAHVDVVVDAEQLAALAAISDVQYLEEASEVALRNSSVRWIVQSNQLNVTPLYDHGLTGAGQIVGIIDSPINEEHCSFFDTAPIGPLHRKILSYNEPLGYSAHGTHVAGTVVGDAGVLDDTRGVAYAARLVYSNVVPNVTQTKFWLHHQQGARLHTNSWGNDATNTYDALARAIDDFAANFEDDLILFAVTNQSTLRNPENAKNLLAVGATRDTPDQNEHCYGGIGPTLDGRRKPEIYAPGCGVMSSSGDGPTCATAADSGTSMACPATAGVTLLARQYFIDGYYPTGSPVALDGFTPTAALLKAVLLNSAVDLTGVAGYPTDLEGWGRVLADNTLAFSGEDRGLWITDVRNGDGFSTGNSVEYPVAVTSPAEKLKVTLVWTDKPGTAGAAIIAVNNLNLEVRAPDNTLYLGNVFASGVSATGGAADEVNNVEQVHVQLPQAGVWRVCVAGAAVNDGPQGFALVVTGAVEGLTPLLRMQLLDDVPPHISPGVPQSFDVRIVPGAEQLAAGSPQLHLRFDDEGPFMASPLVHQGGEFYRATIPAGRCGETIEFYFSALSESGVAVRLPAGAPTATFRTAVGGWITTFADDFETDRGWSVSGDAGDGQWERGVPVNGYRGDPPVDADGSGQCYITDNLAGNSDVDTGTTILTSPVFDLSQGGEVSYAYWLADITTGVLGAEDGMSVEVATNPPGTNWKEIRRYQSPLAAWRTDTVTAGEEFPESATTRVRFLAFDLLSGSVLEAGIDAFAVSHFDCGPAGDGDFDNDEDLDLRDFAAFEACFPATPPLTPSCTPGDMNGDQALDTSDAAAWITRASGPTSPAAHEQTNESNDSGKNPLRQGAHANQAAPVGKFAITPVPESGARWRWTMKGETTESPSRGGDGLTFNTTPTRAAAP